MPRERKVLNAFPAHEVTEITGLSGPMIDYLAREGFLEPTYGNPDRTRGKVRYYSYRDLVVARLIQRLRETGVELRRLKEGVQKLVSHPDWVQLPPDADAQVRWLISDGREVFIRNQDGFLDEVRKGQRAFAFIANLDQVIGEVKRKVPRNKRKRWSIDNHDLVYGRRFKHKKG
jgi:DNA-binding transcriptional MerR regulator